MLECVERKTQLNERHTDTHTCRHANTLTNTGTHTFNTGLCSDVLGLFLVYFLSLNFLVAVVNTLNTKTHSSKEMAEFSFENADVESVCYCKKRMNSKLSLFFEMCENEAL